MVDYFGGRYDIPLMFFGFMLGVSALIYTQIDPSEQLVPDDAPLPVPAMAR